MSPEENAPGEELAKETAPETPNSAAEKETLNALKQGWASLAQTNLSKEAEDKLFKKARGKNRDLLPDILTRLRTAQETIENAQTKSALKTAIENFQKIYLEEISKLSKKGKHLAAYLQKDLEKPIELQLRKSTDLLGKDSLITLEQGITKKNVTQTLLEPSPLTLPTEKVALQTAMADTTQRLEEALSAINPKSLIKGWINTIRTKWFKKDSLKKDLSEEIEWIRSAIQDLKGNHDIHEHVIEQLVKRYDHLTPKETHEGGGEIATLLLKNDILKIALDTLSPETQIRSSKKNAIENAIQRCDQTQAALRQRILEEGKLLKNLHARMHQGEALRAPLLPSFKSTIKNLLQLLEENEENEKRFSSIQTAISTEDLSESDRQGLSAKLNGMSPLKPAWEKSILLQWLQENSASEIFNQEELPYHDSNPTLVAVVDQDSARSTVKIPKGNDLYGTEKLMMEAGLFKAEAWDHAIEKMQKAYPLQNKEKSWNSRYDEWRNAVIKAFKETPLHHRPSLKNSAHLEEWFIQEISAYEKRRPIEAPHFPVKNTSLKALVLAGFAALTQMISTGSNSHENPQTPSPSAQTASLPQEATPEEAPSLLKPAAQTPTAQEKAKTTEHTMRRPLSVQKSQDPIADLTINEPNRWNPMEEDLTIKDDPTTPKALDQLKNAPTIAETAYTIGQAMTQTNRDELDPPAQAVQSTQKEKPLQESAPLKPAHLHQTHRE